MIVAQIGLGGWGLRRAWAWAEAGAELRTFDPVSPSGVRLPAGAVSCASVAAAAMGADLVSVAVPPTAILDALYHVPRERPLFVEKPGAATGNEARRLLDAYDSVVIAYTALYDGCLAAARDDVLGARTAAHSPTAVRVRTARLHHATPALGSTVVEDLLVHDLALCHSLGLRFEGAGVEVAGAAPYEIHVRLVTERGTATFDASLRFPGKVRLVEIATPCTKWSIVPEEFAVDSQGRAVPPGQDRPIVRECRAAIRRFFGDGRATEGEADRVRAVWAAVDDVRRAWR